MLEYLVLATFVTVLAGTTVWAIRAFQSFGRACLKAILPGATGRKQQQEAKPESPPALHTQLENVRVPWGWRRRGSKKPKPVITKTTVTAAHVTPWGWPGANNRKLAQVNGAPLQTRITRQGAGHGVVHLAGSTLVDAGDNDDALLRITRGQSGGLNVMHSEKEEISDARSPWGW